jgi:death-on-curing protein
MMRYLTVREVLNLHDRIIEASGGSSGIRDFGALISAVTQPQMHFEERDLYPSPAEKAAALAYSLIMNHPFLDGNKRVGHAAMEVFLILNGHEIRASLDESESIIVSVAAGLADRAALANWVRRHLARRP